MSVVITIREVPEDVRNELASRAAARGRAGARVRLEGDRRQHPGGEERRAPVIGEVVCDASAIVAPLEADEVREWLAEELEGLATLAFADLVALPLVLCPFEPLAPRVWELRHDLTASDASYVALAELGGAALVTVDYRLAKAPGIQCQVITAPAGVMN